MSRRLPSPLPLVEVSEHGPAQVGSRTSQFWNCDASLPRSKTIGNNSNCPHYAKKTLVNEQGMLQAIAHLWSEVTALERPQKEMKVWIHTAWLESPSHGKSGSADLKMKWQKLITLLLSRIRVHNDKEKFHHILLTNCNSNSVTKICKHFSHRLIIGSVAKFFFSYGVGCRKKLHLRAVRCRKN